MQNFNTSTQNNYSRNRLCESGNENKMRSKRKHSQMMGNEQYNLPLLKKMKTNLNCFPNHTNNNFYFSNLNETNFTSNEFRNIQHPIFKDFIHKDSNLQNNFEQISNNIL